jgi:hypothetical protein
MAKQARAQSGPMAHTQQPPHGSVLPCLPYAGELARHRLITADGYDYVVATLRAASPSGNYLTAAYPVSRGYLVMMRQPLCELRTPDAAKAGEQHEQLVRVLAEAGVKLVRARRALAARHRSETLLLNLDEREAAQPASALSLQDTLDPSPNTPEGALALG